jgi:hypothetical protein
MSKEEKEVEKLFKNIQKGLRVHSIKTFNDKIVEILDDKTHEKDAIECAIEIVCEEYKINRYALIKGKPYKLQEAKIMCYCLLHNCLGLSIRHISDRIFDKFHNSITVGINYYKNLDHKIKAHREFSEKYDRLFLALDNKVKNNQIK